MRHFACAALCALAWFTAPLWAEEQQKSPGTDAEAPTLRIGVRSHARPFSYKSTRAPQGLSISTGAGPIRAEGYDGYLVYVCDEVLKQMLINQSDAPPLDASQIQVEDMDALVAAERARYPDAQFEFDRLDLLGGKIDILCDPATINAERVKRFAVSPPLFIAGIGYLTLKDAVPPRSACRADHALIGFVGATNAASSGIRTIVNAGEWRNVKDSVTAALRDTGPGSGVCPPPAGIDGAGGLFYAGHDHDEVAKRFCRGEVTYYVGDLEIITEHARSVPGCEFTSGARSFTTDRYAIFSKIDYNADTPKAQLISRFYEVLNREIATSASLLDRAFIATFGETPKSQKLELFFWAMRGPP
ncbi:transporter substrate-binding domain-containing protein [uncultured Tateyamaria sp.]|uniref:transporter substrate-binding domain-containing protein n=1 Tax=uncultured Tateyamaria sp. TaxID=455651 RepID=UPI002636761A|nr:transporter substrate-binding domain-containing protein [uncultured Tateyamaria sp.]